MARFSWWFSWFSCTSVLWSTACWCWCWSACCTSLAAVEEPVEAFELNCGDMDMGDTSADESTRAAAAAAATAAWW